MDSNVFPKAKSFIHTIQKIRNISVVDVIIVMNLSPLYTFSYCVEKKQYNKHISNYYISNNNENK